MRGAEARRVCWLGGQEGFSLRDEQRCYGPTQPEGLEGSEKQDLGPWLASAHTQPCQQVWGVGPPRGHSSHQAQASSHSVSPRIGEALGSARERKPST